MFGLLMIVLIFEKPNSFWNTTKMALNIVIYLLIMYKYTPTIQK